MILSQKPAVSTSPKKFSFGWQEFGSRALASSSLSWHLECCGYSVWWTYNIEFLRGYEASFLPYVHGFIPIMAAYDGFLWWIFVWMKPASLSNDWQASSNPSGILRSPTPNSSAVHGRSSSCTYLPFASCTKRFWFPLGIGWFWGIWAITWMPSAISQVCSIFRSLSSLISGHSVVMLCRFPRLEKNSPLMASGETMTLACRLCSRNIVALLHGHYAHEKWKHNPHHLGLYPTALRFG